MNESSRGRRRALCAMLLGMAFTLPAQAVGEAYPSKPIRLVVPFAPGGGNDVVARLVAEYLSPLLGQPVVVENRVGAGGNIGTDFVAKSPADGYTLVHVANTVVMNPYLYKKLPFDIRKDLQPVALLATAPIFVLASPAAGIQSLADLVKQSKERKGGLPYATPGNGTPHHFAMELLKARSGAEMLHIPYRGAGPAVTDVLAGQVPVLAATPSSVAEFVAAGRLKLLATMEPARSTLYPDVPAVAELLPNFQVSIWQGLMLPAGTPAEMVQVLSMAVKRVLDDSAFQKRLLATGFAPKYEPAQAMKDRIAADLDIWRGVAASAGIVPE